MVGGWLVIDEGKVQLEGGMNINTLLCVRTLKSARWFDKCTRVIVRALIIK